MPSQPRRLPAVLRRFKRRVISVDVLQRQTRGLDTLVACPYEVKHLRSYACATSRWESKAKEKQMGMIPDMYTRETGTRKHRKHPRSKTPIAMRETSSSRSDSVFFCLFLVAITIQGLQFTPLSASSSFSSSSHRRPRRLRLFSP